jgi:peptide/nickel transport system substrate-binding protein
VQSQVVQYDRNDGYFMKDEHGAQLPRLHGETMTVVQDPNAAYLRFLSGQIDVYSPRPEEVMDLEDKVRRKELDITIKEIGIDTGSFFFCFNRNPKHYVKNGVSNPKLSWFTDLNFLRAMAHLVDKQSIINLAYQGLAVPAVADISPENKIFHNPNLKDYDYDPKLAADMLEAAGYHLVRPGVRNDPKGNRLEFDLVTSTSSPEREQTCAIFKQDLETLGIKVNYRPLESSPTTVRTSTAPRATCTCGIPISPHPRHRGRPRSIRCSTKARRRWISPSARHTTGRFSRSYMTNCRSSKLCGRSAMPRGRTRSRTTSPKYGGSTNRNGFSSRPTNSLTIESLTR